MTSSSREQGSVITIEFELSRNVDEAANDVRDRVSRIRGQLPREIDDPIISKVDANAQPIVWLALFSEQHSGLELTDVADRILKERIQRLPGVGSVIIGGERRYAMRVWLDPLRMAAHGLTTQDVELAIRRENAEIPAGRVEGAETGVCGPDARGPRDAGGIRRHHRSPEEETTWCGCATSRRSSVGAEDERTVARYNGKPAVGLGIVKQSKASTVDVARNVRNALGGAHGPPPGGDEARRRLRFLHLHQRIHRRGEGNADHRDVSRRAGGARVPEEPAGDDHTRRSRSPSPSSAPSRRPTSPDSPSTS